MQAFRVLLSHTTMLGVTMAESGETQSTDACEFIDLEADVRAVSEARRFVRETLRSWGREDALDNACLAVSELVTNAVVHAQSATRVMLTYSDRAIQLKVCDHSPERPVLYNPKPEETQHRGMLLVDSVSSNWGIDSTADGKLIWLDLTDH